MLRRTLLKGATFSAALVASQALSQSQLFAQSDIKELRFGIISTESQDKQKPLWEPFLAAMSKEIGIPVKGFYATQYAGVIEAMRFKQVEVAWYGGKAYIEAARLADAEAFAYTISNEGVEGYFAHLIMNKAHPMLAQAKQLGGDKFVLQEGSKISFAFNDPNSTSGFLVPGYYVFAQNGVDPKKLFKQLIFSGSHEATALAVANNQVDVATNNNESLTRLETSNPDARAKIEVIWTSPQIPSDPISYRKDLPEDLKKKVQDFFFTFNDKSILDPLQWSTFKPADDSRWNVIRELEYGKQILEIQSSESISQADKEKQVTELQQKIAELKK